MTLRVLTTQEKLHEVERLIVAEKRLTGTESEVLKSIAADLRCRLDGRPSAVLVDIERRVVAVARSKSSTGYSPHSLHGLGEGVAGHWPMIKLALERFGAEVEGS